MLPDIATIAHVCTTGTDTNNVIGRSDLVAGARAQRRVADAGAGHNPRQARIARLFSSARKPASLRPPSYHFVIAVWRLKAAQFDQREVLGSHR
jgi:hypothetical protein